MLDWGGSAYGIYDMAGNIGEHRGMGQRLPLCEDSIALAHTFMPQEGSLLVWHSLTRGWNR